jgi:hypothetical protein
MYDYLWSVLCEALMNKTPDASIKTKAVMMLTTTTFSSLSPTHQGFERVSTFHLILFTTMATGKEKWCL